jgi:DNA polymerase (family X)
LLDSSDLKVYVADAKHFGAALLHATGSPEHLEQLRVLAERKGMRLESDGLHKGRSVVAAQEADIYRALGLPFIEPELREGRGEIERDLKGMLPKLVTDNDLHGILHRHTDASDGTETLDRIAKATRQRGFQYFGVADHSKSAHYAGGLTVEQIEEQHREADRLNKAFGKDFRILKGIESDILAGGALDYPDGVLERFDFVVASIHGRFKMDRKAQTDRLLRAVSNRHTTGRARFRLHDEHQSGRALDPELDHMHWGVEMARKGGVPADRVLNAMSLPEILRYLKDRRRGFARAA